MQRYSGEELDRKIDGFLEKKLAKYPELGGRVAAKSTEPTRALQSRHLTEAKTINLIFSSFKPSWS